MEPTYYTEQTPKTNYGRRIILLVLLVIVAGVLAFVLEHIANEKTLTIQTKPGYTISVGTPSNKSGKLGIAHTITTTTVTKNIRLKQGDYVVRFARSSEYQPLYESITLDHDVTITAPALSYSTQKLTSLLAENSAIIHSAFQSSTSGSLLASGYSIQDVALYMDGSWYAGKLIPSNAVQDNVLVFIMHYEDKQWKLVTTPAISLFVGNYPTIPKSVITAANSSPIGTSTETQSSGNASQNSAAQPPQGVVTAATTYIQNRENSVGADQTSSSSWLTAVQSITTPAFLTQLQPGQSTTGQVSSDYTTAHNSGYVVKAGVSNCLWSQANASNGSLSCSVADTTVYEDGGEQVSAINLPFGWVHNGQQPGTVLSFVNENGTWLINGDSTL